jgi:hypothetical protein
MIKRESHGHQLGPARRRRDRVIRRLVSLLSAFVLISAAGAASAAPPNGSAPSVPTASRPPVGDKAAEEASIRFKRGLQLFDEGDYTLALVEFERAYQLAPNYRALYNIGLVDIQLGRYADAARTLEAYLHDGGDAIAAPRRAEVTTTLAGLKLRTATIDISVSAPGAEVTLDGKPLDPQRLRAPMVIDAGEHTLRATAPGFQAANKTITLAGADRASVRLELAATPLQRSPTETATHARGPFWPGFVITGGFAAGAVVSAAFMLDARSHLSDLQSTPGSDAAQRESTANRVNSAALAADILTGLTVVAGGISVYFSLAPERAAKAPSVAISPQKVALSVPF